MLRSINRRRIPGLLGSVVTRRGNANTTTAASKSEPLRSILIANRGEIALRVNRTASKHGIRTTTIYTDPDADSQHALSSPFAINLGSPSAYLDGDRIIQVARKNGCNGIHPGYGFLSENSTFAKNCTEAGITFIGPPWEAIEAMGNKSRSKEIMIEAGVPCIPGYHGTNQDPAFLKAEAEKIGYPVLLKAVKGGGGKGMRIASTPEVFFDQLESAKTEARNSFGDDVMLVEKYITTPRHIEVQVFADKHGNCVALGERDCSIQRRHQKVIEESPAPHLEESVRQDLWGKARAAALAVGYEGAGTVEFIFDNESREFFFMEMNTRLQVEHPVTEMVTGEDLVHWQLIIAQGGKLPLTQAEIADRIRSRGWGIEARIYAENPKMGFIPDSGLLRHLKLPETNDDVRVDAGFVAGDTVSSHYDPMIAKLIVRAEDRTAAVQKLRTALENYEIAGMTTNIDFIKKVCESPAFIAGDVETGFIPKHEAELFKEDAIPAEIFAQTAFAILAQSPETTTAQPIGFTDSLQNRQFHFQIGSPVGGKDIETVTVDVTQNPDGSSNAKIGDQVIEGVKSKWDPSTSTLVSFFRHTRLDTRLVFDGEGKITIFSRGNQYNLQIATPKWIEKALGVKDLTHSVLAPMPCKVLRVDVKEGDKVTKDQALVVIESMKMETVIRSPQDGVIARVVHKAGDLCKAGTALVEFEE